MEHKPVIVARAGRECDDLLLFDRLHLGVELLFACAGDDPAQHFLQRLSGHSAFQARQRDFDRGSVSLKLPLFDDDGVEVGEASATLFVLGWPDGTFRVTQRSFVQVNLLKPLREHLGVPDELVGLDRNRNVLGATAAVSDDAYFLQFHVARQVIRELQTVIEFGLPDEARLMHERLRLCGVELCHDIVCADPVAVTNAVTRSPVTGSRVADHDAYRDKLYRNRIPVAHWLPKAEGSVFKFYPKTSGLLRVELSCGSTKRVRAVKGTKTAPFTEEGVVEILEAFHQAASESCREALAHIRQVMGSTFSPVDLALKLQPLLMVADRQRSEKGYRPSEKAASEARRVYDELIRNGFALSNGLKKEGQVRKVLDGLCDATGPLQNGSFKGVYTLKPEYGRAALHHDVGANFR